MITRDIKGSTPKSEDNARYRPQTAEGFTQQPLYFDENPGAGQEEGRGKQSYSLSKSVKEFFQQSTDIQDEIKRLFEICRHMSPKPDGDSYEIPQIETQDSQDGYYDWDEINEQLLELGFDDIALVENSQGGTQPDIGSIFDLLNEFIAEFKNKARQLNAAKEDMKMVLDDIEEIRAERDELQQQLQNQRKSTQDAKYYKDMQRHNRHLREKNKKLKNENQDLKSWKDLPEYLQRIEALGISEFEQFKSAIGHEFNKDSVQDYRIMQLIHSLNDKAKKLSDELNNEVKQLSNARQSSDLNIEQLNQIILNLREHTETLGKDNKRLNQMITELKQENFELTESNAKVKQEIYKTAQQNADITIELESLRSNLQALKQENYLLKDQQSKPKPNEQKIQNLCNIVEAQTLDEAIQFVEKMQSVLRAIPTVERFVQMVCEELFPDLPKEPDMITCATRMEEVLPRIKFLRNNNEQLEKLMSSLYYEMGIEESASPVALVNNKQLEKANAWHHFSRLFEVAEGKEVEVVEQIYYFVHEIKEFLRVNTIQNARARLALPNAGVSVVISRILSMI